LKKGVGGRFLGEGKKKSKEKKGPPTLPKQTRWGGGAPWAPPQGGGKNSLFAPKVFQKKKLVGKGPPAPGLAGAPVPPPLVFQRKKKIEKKKGCRPKGGGGPPPPAQPWGGGPPCPPERKKKKGNPVAPRPIPFIPPLGPPPPGPLGGPRGEKIPPIPPR